ncbi:MAG: protein phosphatase 2C domain-containing protein [Pseudomonadota bacterium]
MHWVTAADSNIGGREDQQDRYLLAQSDDGSNHLLVVADGAGGHKTGGLAAQAAIDCIDDNIEELWASTDPDAFIKQLIIECHTRVLAVGGEDLACTTLVMALIRGDEVFWGHVGDSRFYLVRDGETVVKTRDHSLPELQLQASADTDHIVSMETNKLYMCLGAPVDILPEVASSVVREGDTLLLCSDGLWSQIDMVALLADIGDSPVAAKNLDSWINQARLADKENSDNITLLVAKFVGQPSLLQTVLRRIYRVLGKKRKSRMNF